MAKRIRYSFSAILLIFILSSCSTIRFGQAPVTQPTFAPIPSPSPYSLRTLATNQGMLIGTAVDMQAFKGDAQYRNVLAREFNYITPEISLEFYYDHPEPNVYNFQDTDELVAFAQAHNMQFRGHPLIWPHETVSQPDWINKGKFTPDQLKNILHDYITTVVSHYRGKINAWDVLNEAINPDGTLVNCIWLQTLGPSYINWIFQWAHEADPSAKLYYNDYLNENLGSKSTAIYNRVKAWIKQGVPISGVGFEMHIDANMMPDIRAMQANMQRLGALGLEVSITEMDIRTWDASGTTAQKLANQAQIYHNVLAVCLQVSNCKKFTLWGFTDRYSWLYAFTGHADMPLLFTPDYVPKPSYYALINALTEHSLHVTNYK